MHWEVLIIPLIALGVWIIGTLFRSEDEKIKKGVVRRPLQSGGGRAPARRLVTDLDRFLEETRRRREPEERRKAPSPPSRPPTSRPPVRERPARPPGPPPLAQSVTVKEEPVVVLPAPRPVVAPPVVETAPALPSPKMGETRAAAPPAREAPPRPAPAVTRPSPIAQQVRSLLSKPQTAAAAFILHEIFDRPLCKRRR